jgi:prenyltransferase beta subunit
MSLDDHPNYTYLEPTAEEKERRNRLFELLNLPDISGTIVEKVVSNEFSKMTLTEMRNPDGQFVGYANSYQGDVAEIMNTIPNVNILRIVFDKGYLNKHQFRLLVAEFLAESKNPGKFRSKLKKKDMGRMGLTEKQFQSFQKFGFFAGYPGENLKFCS